MSLLDVRDLTVNLDGLTKPVSLVRELSFSVERGEFLCIVGESGSGKTVAALSLMRLLEYTAPTSIVGSALLDGTDMVAASQDEMSALRGKRIAMIFQEAMEALNPTKVIGAQLIEAAQQHPESRSQDTSRRDNNRHRNTAGARAKALDLLNQVGIPDPSGCMEKYPHQLSGGMQQRAMIAMALMCDPELLIADEPTTALDVTIQAEILSLLVRLQRERDMACILITHDMGVAAEIADRVAVMYASRLVEIGTVQEILTAPRHPYTRALLECVPRVGLVAQQELRTIAGSVPHPGQELPGCRFAPRCPNSTSKCTELEPDLSPMAVLVDAGRPELSVPRSNRLVACWHPQDTPIPNEEEQSTAVPAALDPASRSEQRPYVVLDKVSKHYSSSARGESLGSKRATGGTLAVDEATVTITRGEFFGLVGESGSGKSTLGKLIARLEPMTSGHISVGETKIEDLRRRKETRDFRREVQIVFQDTTGSLDPRQTIGRSICEPLKSLTDLRGEPLETKAKELLEIVGLPVEYYTRMPSELSGGQRQRVAIARAIACDPQLVVADEPTSALDVSVQGQIVNVLRRLQRELGLTYLFITHNLSLVLSVADRVGVMYLGALVEIADASILISKPAHPYTEILLKANPDPHNPRRRTAGEAVQSNLALDSETALVDRSVGCRFRDRCPRRQEICDTDSPALTPHRQGQLVACHFPLD